MRKVLVVSSMLASLLCFDANAQIYTGNSSYLATKNKVNVAPKKKNEFKPTSFKRRVYEGPSYNELKKRAAENAKNAAVDYLPKGNFDLTYGDFAYNESGDVLSVSNIVAKSKNKNSETDEPYVLFTVKSAKITGFNLGELDETPVNETGILEIEGIDINLYDANMVKKGKRTIGSIRLVGEALKILQKNDGKFDILQIKDLYSEILINKIVRETIIQSELYKANNITFYNGSVNGALMNLGKEKQFFDGLTLTNATIDGSDYSTMNLEKLDMVIKKMSSRVIDIDKIASARAEKQKDPSERDFSNESLKNSTIMRNEKRAKLLAESKL
ncbi:MAG: hypothetical protein MJ247_00970 [Alphaproteobacteria bacterium]|nr:hypothetical protein [Alphaproteobacteria bacterium]